MWLSKRFRGGEERLIEQHGLEKLIVGGLLTHHVLMVSKHVPGAAEEIVYVWLKNGKLRALFPGFEAAERPTGAGRFFWPARKASTIDCSPLNRYEQPTRGTFDQPRFTRILCMAVGVF
jgi:hypothetical protein